MKNLIAGSLLAGALAAFASPEPKALVIMLDGFRADVLENAVAPNMQRFVEGKWQDGYNCAWSFSAQTVPDALASSAPNHSAIALGVTTAKNKVENNGQYAKTDYAKYPSFLVRIAEAKPDAKTLFLYSWKADGGLCPSSKVEFRWSRETASGQGLKDGTMRTCDRANGIELEKRLASAAAPDATLFFIDCPDWGGHGHLTGDGTGFYPYSTAYLGTINEADAIIGRCLNAIARRPTFKDEDWLVIITSDHGGYSTTHGLKGGHATAIPLIVSSRHVKHGRIPGTPHNYDVAPTVLAHFGIDFSGFDLDGKVVGGETVIDSVRSLADGLAVYLPCDGKKPETTVNHAGNPCGTALSAAAAAAEIQGDATFSGAKGGYFEGCLTIAPDTNGVGGVRLKGSEALQFENGADFALTMWVKMAAPQKGDALIFGNKNWRSGGNPGIALCASKCTEKVKIPGVVFNSVAADGRTDIGTYDIEYGKWVFYAVTRGADGVLRLYQGGSDGRLYSISGNTEGIKFATGLPFYIGQDGTGRYGRTFAGQIDDFALWTRTLSHDDIRRIYESARKGFSIGDLLGLSK